MLIYFKLSIKTSLLILLFIAGSGYLSAGNFRMDDLGSNQWLTSKSDEFYRQQQTVQSPDDTIKKESLKSTEVVKKDEMPLSGETFDFQVNSDISYLCMDHFVKSESKKMFSDARIKEKELMRISSQTDSLRKVYTSSPNGKKEEIAVLILRKEEQSMALNSEIPVLYRNARNLEDQYWQTAPMSEKIRFQEKIKSFRDSLALRKMKEETEMKAKIQKDSILIPNEPSQRKVATTETATSAIVYKIQIGAYKGKIPESATKMIKKLSVIRKVENSTDDKGLKVYTTGNLKTYQEAVTLQAQVKQEGVKNPVIIAFQKGKKIEVNDAKKLNHEL